MKRQYHRQKLSLSISALLLSFLLLGACAPETSNTSGEAIDWLSPQEAYAKIQANPGNDKKVMVDLYTDWCGWCKKMDKTTFQNDKVITKLKQNFYPVKFDAESKKSFKINGKKLEFRKQGKRGVHEFAAKYGSVNGKMSYPTLIFLNERFKKIQAIPGFRSSEDLLPILTFLGEDYHKQMKWKDFKSQYSAGQLN
jgi:thioredoxin-related protein